MLQKMAPKGHVPLTVVRALMGSTVAARSRSVDASEKTKQLVGLRRRRLVRIVTQTRRLPPTVSTMIATNMIPSVTMTKTERFSQDGDDGTVADDSMASIGGGDDATEPISALHSCDWLLLLPLHNTLIAIGRSRA
jgi:hypothetical protein